MFSSQHSLLERFYATVLLASIIFWWEHITNAELTLIMIKSIMTRWKGLFQSAPFVVDSQEMKIIRLWCLMTQIICLLTHSLPVVLTLIILSALFTTGIETAHVQHLLSWFSSGTKSCKNNIVWKWPANCYLAWDTSYYFIPPLLRIQFRARAQLLNWFWWSSLFQLSLHNLPSIHHLVQI